MRPSLKQNMINHIKLIQSLESREKSQDNIKPNQDYPMHKNSDEVRISPRGSWLPIDSDVIENKYHRPIKTSMRDR